MENRETRQISEFKLIDELERNTLFMNISMDQSRIELV
jgi:hypothetical protein